MENVYYIYEWYNIETGEVFYVGKGKTRRKNDLFGRNKFFIDYYNTHKCCNRIILSQLEEKEAFEFEKKIIKYYKDNTNFRLTNQTEGGEGASKFGAANGMHHTNYTRPLEWRKQHSLRMKGNQNAKGCIRSTETRKKLSNSLCGEKHPMFGKHHSEETKRKMSINSYYKTEEGKKAIKKLSDLSKKKVVFTYEDGKVLVFNSMKEATQIMSSDLIRKYAKSKKPFYSKLNRLKHLNGIRVELSGRRSTTRENIV